MIQFHTSLFIIYFISIANSALKMGRILNEFSFFICSFVFHYQIKLLGIHFYLQNEIRVCGGPSPKCKNGKVFRKVGQIGHTFFYPPHRQLPRVDQTCALVLSISN